jgi:hypothetical protein
MYPISNERLLWLEARIFLLGRMINELTLRQARYQTRPQYAQQHHNVMSAMIAEQLQLNIEKNCIEAYNEEQAQAAEADMRRQEIQDRADGKS